MSELVEAGEKRPRSDGRWTVAEAAGRFACHPETIRRRIRSGELPAIRGPHGRYLVRDADLERTWVQPRPDRPPRLYDDASWAALAGLVHRYERTQADVLALLEEVRSGAGSRPRLARLVEVQRLRISGMGFAAIASRLSLSERHLRRLAHRDLEIALRVELIWDRQRRLNRARRQPRPWLQAIEERLRAAGYTGLGRAEVVAAWPRRIGVLHRRLSLEQVRQLRVAGLSAEELEAIRAGGLASEALNYLLTYGFGTRDPAGHTTGRKD